MQVGRADRHELTNVDLSKCLPELAIRKAEKQPCYPGKDPQSLRNGRTSVNGCDGKIKTEGMVECLLKENLELQIAPWPQLSGGYYVCSHPSRSLGLYSLETSVDCRIPEQGYLTLLQGNLMTVYKTKQFNDNVQKTGSPAAYSLFLSRQISWTTSPKGNP